MLGPKQRLLASYVASANDEPLDTAGQQWKTGEGLLRRVASQLRGAVEPRSAPTTGSAVKAPRRPAGLQPTRRRRWPTGPTRCARAQVRSISAAIAVRHAKTANHGLHQARR